MNKNILELKDLKTYFNTDDGLVKAVDGVSFNIEKEHTVGLVGESGCGKTVTSQSILKIIPYPGEIYDGQILYTREDGTTIDLAQLDPWGKEIRAIRGEEIGFVFQEPMTSLSPVHTVGNQLCETISLHRDNLTNKEARAKSMEMLGAVGLPDAEGLMDRYIHELSGGMRQRVMIALALICNPRMLIADEPTTAVDVTIQAKNLDLLNRLQEELGMSLLIITHDLGVVAEMADEVVVMYLGKIVSKGTVRQIFNNPKHPYTKALLKSIPRADRKSTKNLDVIKGSVPDPFSRPQGCYFGPRCEEFEPGLCDQKQPPIVELEDKRQVRCFRYSEGDNR